MFGGEDPSYTIHLGEDLERGLVREGLPWAHRVTGCRRVPPALRWSCQPGTLRRTPRVLPALLLGVQDTQGRLGCAQRDQEVMACWGAGERGEAPAVNCELACCQGERPCKPSRREGSSCVP